MTCSCSWLECAVCMQVLLKRRMSCGHCICIPSCTARAALSASGIRYGDWISQQLLWSLKLVVTSRCLYIPLQCTLIGSWWHCLYIENVLALSVLTRAGCSQWHCPYIQKILECPDNKNLLYIAIMCCMFCCSYWSHASDTLCETCSSLVSWTAQA